MPIEDMKEAFDTIKAKRARYNLLFDYYKGLHPLKYSASRLRDAFERLDTYFAQNWVAVIVDSVLDRLVLKGFDVSKNVEADAKLDELWKDYNISLLADDVHEAAIVAGEGYIIALPTEEDDTETPYDIYFNDPRMCHLFYEFDRPQKKRFAAKIYIGKDRYARMALYYSDHFEYYTSTKKLGAKEEMLSTSASFVPDTEMPNEANPFDEIPVFRFGVGGVSKRKDLGPSEISLQDAINKLLSDMMVSAEFNTFVQRIIISQSDPGNLTNKPGANWWIPAGDGKSQQAQVFELGGRNLEGFLKAISELATSLAVISRTPKHYFFLQGGDPSGEALISMEGPLTKKVQKRIEAFSVEWQSFARFLLKLEGIKDVKKSQIIPQFGPVETISQKSAADTTKVRTDSGIPLITALRWEGKTQQDIKQFEDDKAQEKKSMTGLAQNALDQLRAADQQNNNSGGVPNNQNMQNNQNNQQMMNNQNTPNSVTNVSGNGSNK